LKISWGDNEYGQGPAGTAIRTRQPSIVSNVMTDPKFAPWREKAVKSGYMALMAIPLISSADNRAIGSLNVYTDQPQTFSGDEIVLMKELANDLATGIIIIKSRLELQRNHAELLRISRELEQSNRELEHFADVVSHDLREPLRAVSGFVELLKMRYADKLDKTANEYIDFAFNGAKKMRTMLLGLLEYSRVQSHGHAFTQVDMNRALKDAMDNLIVSISENKAQITYDQLPVVKGDELQLVRLLQNLIHNGLKYRRSEIPKIHVSCRREENQWVFSVRDNGIGMSEHFLKEIFTIFKREHKKKQVQGDGVGLAVCKRIVERHNGRIWVESEEDKGSTFYFSIPD